MRKILVTGMSGTGKSSALVELGKRGHRVVDTDTDEWSRWVTYPDGSTDWVWREAEIAALLDGHPQSVLFVSGCKSNQAAFYSRFDEIVLLSAPAEVILERVLERENNPYGKSVAEQALIMEHLAVVEPMLRRTATAEVDATVSLAEVVRQLEHLGTR